MDRTIIEAGLQEPRAKNQDYESQDERIKKQEKQLRALNNKNLDSYSLAS